MSDASEQTASARGRGRLQDAIDVICRRFGLTELYVAPGAGALALRGPMTPNPLSERVITERSEWVREMLARLGDIERVLGGLHRWIREHPDRLAGDL